ncbi:MAG: amino acid racemase [Tissierellia bacterium]|nr:amino acid racemase [Tissierellia bacterium]
MKKTVGIIGGMGPKATALLFELIIDLKDAKKDQDNVDLIIMNRASIPDRTAFLKGESDKNPLPYLINEIKRLEKCEVDAYCVACNTSHYFKDEFTKASSLPFIDMLEETVKIVKIMEKKKVALMTTTGTMQMKLYQKALEKFGIEYLIPSDENQKLVMRIIYENVKANKPIEWDIFNKLIDSIKNDGADSVILGCTELSIVKYEKKLDDDFFIDSSESLAKAIIEFSK